MHVQEIIQLIREQNEQGIEELLRHYGPLMRYIIAPILPNKQDQEECVSDVVWRVWDKIDTYDLQQERRLALQKAIAKLPERERCLIYRKYYYMQSTSQIASELGMTQRAVEGKLYRAKKKLQKALGGVWNE